MERSNVQPTGSRLTFGQSAQLTRAGSTNAGTLGSIPHAARWSAVASQPRSRASRRRLAGRAGTTGAPGKALRLSLFTRPMTAQAIINEKSIVIFFSSKTWSLGL
ncbi:hypothetical protein J2S94_000539 [Arthrobacter bambusae]|nr:hypothetical protein [Arthrobacter bambusae]